MLIIVFRCLLIALLISASAFAGNVYTYTYEGLPFTILPPIPWFDTSWHVTASLTSDVFLTGYIDDVSQFSSWSIIMGPFLWSSAVGDLPGGNAFWIDTSGIVVQWDFPAGKKNGALYGYPYIHTTNGGDSFSILYDNNYVLADTTTPGTWSFQQTSGVPEPGSMAYVLLAAGCIFLRLVRSQKAGAQRFASQAAAGLAPRGEEARCRYAYSGRLEQFRPWRYCAGWQ